MKDEGVDGFEGRGVWMSVARGALEHWEGKRWDGMGWDRLG